MVAGRRPLIIELDALRFPAPPSPAAVAARDVYMPRDRVWPTTRLTSKATVLAEAADTTALAAAAVAEARDAGEVEAACFFKIFKSKLPTKFLKPFQ